LAEANRRGRPRHFPRHRAPSHRRPARCPRQGRQVRAPHRRGHRRARRDHQTGPRDGGASGKDCLMADRATKADAAGILPKSDQRPPLFAFSVSLYKSDLLVRGLVDLAVSGFVILAVSGGAVSAWGSVKSAVNSLIGVIQQSTSEIRVSAPAQLTTPTG